MGEENHNLCCVFLPILPDLRDLHPLHLVPNLVILAQLVVCLPGKHEVVGSNLGCCVTFSRKISRCLAGVLFITICQFAGLKNHYYIQRFITKAPIKNGTRELSIFFKQTFQNNFERSIQSFNLTTFRRNESIFTH